MRLIALTSLCVLCVLVAGCSPASGPTPAGSAVAPASSAPAPSLLPETSWSEAEVSGDLESMVLTISDEGLVTVAAQGPTPATGTVMYSASLGGRYQIGLKSMSGEVVAFVFDFDTSSQENLTSAYTYADGQAVVRAPATALSELRAPFAWTGALTVEGTDVGAAAGEQIG